MPKPRSVHRGLLSCALTIAAVTMCVPMPRVSAAVADHPVRDAGSRSAIPGSYIVMLKDDEPVRVNGVTVTAAALAQRHHARLGHVWTQALHGFSVSMSADDAQQLAQESDVAYVEQNQRWRIASTQGSVVSWGLDRVDQQSPVLDAKYHYLSSAGSGVHVYVVDTGIRATQKDLGTDKVTGGVNEIADGHTQTDDCNGHGTAVAGIIAGIFWGVAKAADLIPVRAFDCNGMASTTSIQDGINWIFGQVVDPGTGKPRFPSVINLSISRACTDAAGMPGACPAGDSQAIITAENKAINAGIPVVAAAGNENQLAANNPFAASPNVITVGATDMNDARWFVDSTHASNFGPAVKIWAPGERIKSDGSDDDEQISIQSGTSMAAAFVCGAVALLMGTPQFAHATPAQILKQLQDNATKGILANLGDGSPNLMLYTAPPPNGQPIALALDADDKMNLFGVDPNGNIIHRVETQPGDDTWGGWLPPSHYQGWSAVGAELGITGLVVAGLTTKNEVFNRRQASVRDNKWVNWSQLDGLCVSVAMARSPDGRLEMVCTNRKGQAFYRRQTSPGGKAWGPWHQFTTTEPMITVTAATTSDGRVTVVGVDEAGAAWVSHQSTANTDDWSTFTKVDPAIPIVVQGVALARSLSGQLELVGVDPMGGEWLNQEDASDPAIFPRWSPMAPLPPATLTYIVAEPNVDSRIVLVGVDATGAIYESVQATNDPVTFSAWRKLDGQVRPS